MCLLLMFMIIHYLTVTQSHHNSQISDLVVAEESLKCQINVCLRLQTSFKS